MAHHKGHWLETYRGVVQAWECDAYGHMNVQFYVGRISDAAGCIGAAIGLGPKAISERRLGFVAVRQEIDYRRELHGGDLTYVKSAIAAAEGKKLKLRHRLYRAETNELSAEANVLCLLMHLDTRRAVPVPDDVLALCQPYMVGDAA